MSNTDNFADAADFQRQSDSFAQWLAQQPGVTISPSIQIQDLRHKGCGRGVVACRDIQEGEDLFSIPRNVILMVENSRLNAFLPEQMKELGPWLSLVVVMIHEFLLGEQSSWKHYFQVLPKQFDTLMFWSGEEISKLQASPVIDRIGKESADEDFLNAVLPFVRQHPDFFPPIHGTTSYDTDTGTKAFLELAHVMGSLIMAYAFDVEKSEDAESDGEDGYVTDDEEMVPKGMVPLADLLNADADRNNARLFQEEGALVMKAIKPIKEGDELFNDYGNLPRSELLRRYGYVTDNYAQYDVAELPLICICDAAGVKLSEQFQPGWLQSVLDELDILADGYPISRPSSDESLVDIMPEVIAFLNMLCLDPKEQQRLLSKNKFPEPTLGAREARMLLSAVTAQLSRYGTTIEQDKATLQELSLAPALSTSDRRHKMAIEVRIGEKEILGQVCSMVREFLASQDNGNGKRTAQDRPRQSKKAKVRR